MGAETDRASPRSGVPAPRRSRRHRSAAAIAAILLVGAGLSSCTPEGGSGATGPTRTDDRSTSASGDAEAGDGDVDDGEALTDVLDTSYEELLADSDRLVGTNVRVTGNVFFLAECPPPGAGDAKCVLLGFLASPEQRTFIAADAAQAVALAEDGRRVSCEEGSQPTPTCGDWTANATYTLEGTLQRQVLGGRETGLLQLDVAERSAPNPL